MISRLRSHPLFSRCSLAFFGGLLLPLSFAPYSIWPLGLLALGILTLSLIERSASDYFKISICFGLGMFGAGASWVYVSIHDFGFTGVPLAVVMTTIFVVFLSSVFSLPYLIFRRCIHPNPTWLPASLAAVWVLGEWLRSWLFTGFPWLYVGYAHIDTPLAGFAPLGGVFTLSFIASVSASVIVCFIYSLLKAEINRVQSYLQICLIVILWAGGFALSKIEWTEKNIANQSVTTLQPNVSLFKKWDPFYHPEILFELRQSADEYQNADIQVWPEAAIPSVYNESKIFIDEINTNFANTNIFTGVLFDEDESREVYNSITGLGAAKGIYFKQKLVPFGEYVPFEDQLRGLINFFDLPNSVIRKGPYRPNALTAKTRSGYEYHVSPFICYEVVYPDFVRQNAAQSELMITISNDAWFGDSAGPHQHFDMARMRALENGKYLIRATNTGISAIIDHQGKIQSIEEQFIRGAVSGYVELRNGFTPFTRLGSWPIIFLCLTLIVINGLYHIRNERRKDGN